MLPQNNLFIEVKSRCLDLFNEKTVYDYLPKTDVGYPLIFIGESYQIDTRTKSYIYGQIKQTVHIYNDYKLRGQTSKIAEKIISNLRTLEGKTYKFDLIDTNILTMEDNTAERPLIHQVVELTFSYN